jgi:osmotically-inducible protein OsmY
VAEPHAPPPNDAHLIQLVRGALGRVEGTTRGLPRLNVSSCKHIVTLHGISSDSEERRAVEEAVLRVPGVRGVVNQIAVRAASGT